MSFKTAPSNPGPAFRNLFPIRESVPTARATSLIFAPVFSHKAETEFIELILCAKKHLQLV